MRAQRQPLLLGWFPDGVAFDWLPDAQGNHPLAAMMLADHMIVDPWKPFGDNTFLEIERAAREGRPHETMGGRSLNDDCMDTLYTYLVNAAKGPRISDHVDVPTKLASRTFSPISLPRTRILPRRPVTTEWPPGGRPVGEEERLGDVARRGRQEFWNTGPMPTEPGAPSPVVSLPNLRDLGGYRGYDGNPTSAASSVDGFPPDGATADLPSFEKLGVRTIYDLLARRRNGRRFPDPALPEVADVHLDVLADAETAIPANLAQFFSDPETVRMASQELSGGKARTLSRPPIAGWCRYRAPRRRMAPITGDSWESTRGPRSSTAPLVRIAPAGRRRRC